MKKKINILAVYGIPDDDKISVVLNEGLSNKLHPRFKGVNIITQLINKEQFFIQNIVLGGIKENFSLQLSQPDVIYNSICNYDIQKKSLASFESKFLNSDIPVLNHPDGIKKTTRDSIYENLKDSQNFTVPKTIRLKPRSVKDVLSIVKDNGIDFPFIFRTTGDNNGNDTELINSIDEKEKLEKFAFDGREFYAIAFHNYKSDDGLFRKYRVVVIDGKAIIRHLLVSKNWKIDDDAHLAILKEKPEIEQEEESFLQKEITSNVLKMVEEVYEYTQLDYFGIDFYVNEKDEVLLFEANCCMKPYSGKASGNKYSQKNARKIIEMIEKMFKNKSNTNKKEENEK